MEARKEKIQPVITGTFESGSRIREQTAERRKEVGKMEYSNVFKSKDGVELEMKIKSDCSTQEEMRETIRFIAQSSRKFYMETAEKIKSTL